MGIASVQPSLETGQRIIAVRGMRVMLDADLAQLYGVETKRLNEQVRRNQGRFPDDFSFRLTSAERSEVVANCDHLQRLRFSPSLPLAFTEHGALMAASVLNTANAVRMSVYVIRAFVALRDAMGAHKEIIARLAELQARVSGHDKEIGNIVSALRELAAPRSAPNRPIGFVADVVKKP